jgi:hypothetical protein
MQPTVDIVTAPRFDINAYLDTILSFFVSNFPDFFRSISGYFIGLSIIVSMMLFLGIIYSVEKLKQIRRKESEVYDKKIEMGYEVVKKGEPELALKWEKVKTHIESENENDWRHAIIEADIILGELLTKMGYRGDGIGEQLRRIEKSDFDTLDQAWEAHKARNAIAHEGSEYLLSRNEAKRIISLYRQVFEEFFYI